MAALLRQSVRSGGQPLDRQIDHGRRRREPRLAARQYALVYFTAVWKAALLGVLLGSLVQVLIPRDWLARTLGHWRFSGTVLGR